MENEKNKKEWTKPVLIILCPGGLNENVLSVTTAPPPWPPGSGPD